MTNKKQTELDYDKLFLAYEECRADATAHFIKILELQKKNEKLQERVKELEAQNKILIEAMWIYTGLNHAPKLEEALKAVGVE